MHQEASGFPSKKMMETPINIAVRTRNQPLTHPSLKFGFLIKKSIKNALKHLAVHDCFFLHAMLFFASTNALTRFFCVT